MAVIRPARAADAAGIAKVHVATWRTTYPGLIPDTYLLSLSPRLYAERWRAMLSRRATARGTFVAVEPPHGVVGFASCGSQRTELEGFSGEFYAIYLYDFVQGRGLGRQLMAAMAADMKRAGMDSALVWVLSGNPARWFYERLGGVRVAEQKITFAGAPLTEVAYGWRDLAPLARLSADPRVR